MGFSPRSNPSSKGPSEEPGLIRFFREELKPSVKAQMEQRGRELDSWEELVEKAINAEAKASLQPPSILREMDQRCQRGNRPATLLWPSPGFQPLGILETIPPRKPKPKPR